MQFSQELITINNVLTHQKPSKSELNTTHILSLLRDHKLIGQFDFNLKTGYDSIRDKLKEVTTTRTFHQLELLRELIRIQEHLQSIPVIALKGPILSYQIYNDPARRTSRDLDILVNLKDVEKAIELLTELGYKPLTTFNSPKQKKAILKHLHHIDLIHENLEMIVEIHWNLSSVKNTPIGLNDLTGKTSEIILSETTFSVLKKDILVGYLCLHGVFHGFFRLQWLYDLYSILIEQQETEEAKLFAFLKAEGLSDFYIIARHLLFDIYNLTISEQIIEHTEAKHYKLIAIAKVQISNNDSYLMGPRKRSGLRKMITEHKVQYYIGGFKALIQNIISRNIRPKNWSFFAFPDYVFFLNHVFSRPILLLGKLFGKLQ
jgi:hypothetical protein